MPYRIPEKEETVKVGVRDWVVITNKKHPWYQHCQDRGRILIVKKVRGNTIIVEGGKATDGPIEALTSDVQVINKFVGRVGRQKTKKQKEY